MTSSTRFFSKAFKKIEQIDKKHLTGLASDLLEERKLLGELLDTVQEGVLVIARSTMQIIFMNLNARLMLSGNSNLDFPYGLCDKIITDHALSALITQSVMNEEEVHEKACEIMLPRYLSIRLSVRRLWRFNRPEENANLKDVYCVLLNPASAKFEQAKEEEQLERTASILSLASGIAHEIGNPLNSINIHLHLLSKELDKLPANSRNRLKKSVQVVVEETERLDKIVRNFLRAARRHPIHFELGNIQEIVQNVLILFKPELRSNRIKLETHFDSEIPQFFMDLERINLVFTNVIKNAIQAMPKGGALFVSIKRHKNLCLITIADTGIGIEKESLPKVFDAYYTTKEEGSGLGLVIAYQIIREHGGRIEIKSEIGKGTNINVLLPIQKEKLSLPSPAEGAKDEQFI